MIPVVFINNNKQYVKQVPKFKLTPTTKQFFRNSNLQVTPLVFTEDSQIGLVDEQQPKRETYNFIVDESFLKNGTIQTVTTQLSIQKLIQYKQQINIWHTFENEEQIIKLQKLYQNNSESVKIFYFDLIKELSEDKQLLQLYQEKMVPNINSQYVQIHIKSLMRVLILYKYGGWFIEMPTLIINPMIGDKKILFTSFNDQNKVYAFSNSIAYVPPRNWFIKQILQIIPQIYNPDDYNVIDTYAPKIVYQNNLQNPQLKQVQILSTDFYLPQISDPQVFKLFNAKGFDNSVYGAINKKNAHKLFSLRYYQYLNSQFCDQTLLSVTTAIEGLSNTTICN